MYTSVFRCPVTGECFASGRYGNKLKYEVREETTSVQNKNDIISILWYGKKKTAEYAVAAKELGCLSFREGGGLESMCYGICLDKPYLSSEYAPSLSCTAPENLFSDVFKPLVTNISLSIDISHSCKKIFRNREELISFYIYKSLRLSDSSIIP